MGLNAFGVEHISKGSFAVGLNTSQGLKNIKPDSNFGVLRRKVPTPQKTLRAMNKFTAQMNSYNGS